MLWYVIHEGESKNSRGALSLARALALFDTPFKPIIHGFKKRQRLAIYKLTKFWSG